ncbi:MAG TPA: copper oxidase [Thermoanaerobaculia bacterium]
MISRRGILASTIAALGGAVLGRRASAQSGPQTDPRGKGLAPPRRRSGSRTRVLTPNGASLPWRMENGVKVFHLIAEPVRQELAPGHVINAWGYNGRTPGPTIEAIEGDRVRIYVTNRLSEGTSIHWHGVILPNGMDGVSGLTQPKIGPGETFAYEFTLKQSGTLMYHPHFDEMAQVAMGMQGFFIIHPRDPNVRRVDRDYAIFLQEWFVKPGTMTPDPTVMLDFNTFAFNGRIFPATQHLPALIGERVRIRLANVTMDSHPIHIHGHRFYITGTDAGPIPESGWWPENTANVPVGTTRDIEFTADNPGDWAYHCHKSHHTMNQMGHDLPNLIGVDVSGFEERVNRLIPGTMIMGASGMGDMMRHMTPDRIPRNTVPMLGLEGPFGPIEMGGMMTVIKVRDSIPADLQNDWYRHPPGTVAWPVPEMSTTPAQTPAEHRHGGESE